MKFIPQYHVTTTERKAITAMFEQGGTYARNRPDTKRYELMAGTQQGQEMRYTVRIGTYATHSIGRAPGWQYQNCDVVRPIA